MFCRDKLKLDILALFNASSEKTGECCAYKDVASRADRTNKKLWNEKARRYEPFTKAGLLAYLEGKIEELAKLEQRSSFVLGKLRGYKLIHQYLLESKIGFRENSPG